LIILNVIEKRYINTYSTMVIEIAADDRRKLLDDIHSAINNFVKSAGSPSVEKNIRSKRVKVVYTVKILANIPVEQILEKITEVDGIRSIKVT
jgi:hypothetical protein